MSYGAATASRLAGSDASLYKHSQPSGDCMTLTARRLTRDDWLVAAREALTRSGVDDVKVDRLARDLKMTRGSFYWHFTSRKDLLDALLHDWELRNLNQIDYLRDAWAADAPDLAYVNVIYAGGDEKFPAYDMSVRVWARKAPAVAAAVARIDDAWIAVFKEMFIAQGFDETESFVRARITYFHQIGYYALAIQEDIEERVRLIPYYYKILAGRDASPRLNAIMSNILAKKRKSTAAKAKGSRLTPGKRATRAPRPASARTRA